MSRGKAYEKDITSGTVTTYYFLGDKLVADREGTTLECIQQDHLSGTGVTSDTGGASVASLTYYPYGTTTTSSGTLSTVPVRPYDATLSPMTWAEIR